MSTIFMKKISLAKKLLQKREFTNNLIVLKNDVSVDKKEDGSSVINGHLDFPLTDPEFGEDDAFWWDLAEKLNLGREFENLKK
jgi:hypothetical protein